MKPILPLLLLAAALAGCRTAPAPQAGIPADPAYERLMIRAAEAVARGQYANAGALYAQAFDRAKVLDRRGELVRASLCLAASAVNAEDAVTAESALRAYREVVPAGDPTALRAADLAVRLAWLKDKRAPALPELPAPPLDRADARLTRAEAALRAGAAPVLPDGTELAALPPSLQARAHALAAWQARDSAAWLAAARAYSELGNTAAAFREALRCAEILKDPEAARTALRIAEGLHDARRQQRARALLRPQSNK